MDIGLPDVDGYAVTHQIRIQELAKKAHIPIIALTAHAGDENKQRCIEAGMNAVLTKPLTAKAVPIGPMRLFLGITLIRVHLKKLLVLLNYLKHNESLFYFIRIPCFRY